MEVIKDIEEFFLRFFFADDELEIINDKAVEFLEFSAKFFAFAVSDGINEVGVKIGDGGVEDFVRGVVFNKFVADGLDEVGFAKTGATVKEEGVTASAGCVDNTTSGSDGDIVVGADDKTVDGVLRVKAVVLGWLDGG